MNLFSLFESEKDSKCTIHVKICSKVQKVILHNYVKYTCSMKSVQQNGGFTLFRLISTLYLSILFGSRLFTFCDNFETVLELKKGAEWFLSPCHQKEKVIQKLFEVLNVAFFFVHNKTNIFEDFSLFWVISKKSNQPIFQAIN